MIAAAWPISGACHLESQTFLRLSGATEALQQAHRQLGGEILSSGDDFWTALREQTLPFFQGTDPLWRCSVPPMAANPPWPAQVCMDWVGGLRWLKSAEDAETIHRYARDAGGHARCIRGHEAGIAQNFASLSHPLLALHQRVKQAFDPAGILNPGGLFPGW
jgi:glycolate oxidase FAD binding subunit